jgi:hypothetical protein
MSNVEAIKAKLLEPHNSRAGFMYPRRNPDGPEAVAVIEALVAENEKLKAKVYSLETRLCAARD